jgi:hypothetical protein
MNVRASASNLVQAMKQLRAEWEQTTESWRDTKADEFAKTCLDDLPHHVARTAAVIEELDVLLRKVRLDCE